MKIIPFLCWLILMVNSISVNAQNLTPPNGTEEVEEMVTLNYTVDDSTLPVDCTILNLANATESTIPNTTFQNQPQINTCPNLTKPNPRTTSRSFHRTVAQRNLF